MAKHRKVEKANKRRDARRERFDAIKDATTKAGMKRPGSRNPHKGA